MELLLKQIEAIIDNKVPLVSNLSNIAALLYKLDNINWAGFYINEDNNLYLGPFQGDVACTYIPYGKGVCGTCLKEKRSIIVSNVNEFKGHIACSSLSKSEIVVPVIVNNEVKLVIDIDAPIFNRFTEKEEDFFLNVAELIAKLY